MTERQGHGQQHAKTADLGKVVSAVDQLVQNGTKGDVVQVELGGRGQVYVKTFSRHRPGGDLRE